MKIKTIKNRPYRVRDLIALLNELDPETEVMVNTGLGGLMVRPVLVAEGDVPLRPSFDMRLKLWAVKKWAKDKEDKLVYFEMKKSLKIAESAPKGYIKVLGIG